MFSSAERPVAALTARISAIATPEDSDVIRKDFEDSSSHGSVVSAYHEC